MVLRCYPGALRPERLRAVRARAEFCSMASNTQLSNGLRASQDLLRNACVVTPTYNERGNITKLIELIGEACNSTEFRMLVMDDGSPDGTADAVDEMRSRYPNVRAIRRKGDRGYGKAVVDGILEALDMDVEFIVCMDADLQHSPEIVPEMLAAAKDYDLVIGSRYMSGSATVADWPVHRLVMSRMANFYLHVMTWARVDDATSGFRCWRTSFIRRFPLRNLQAGGFAFLYETLFYAGLNKARIKEVQNFHRGRTYGESKMNGRIIIESLWVPFRLRMGHMLGRHKPAE